MNKLFPDLTETPSNLTVTHLYLFIYLFIMGLGLSSGLPTCKAGTLPHEPHLQSKWNNVFFFSFLLFFFFPSLLIGSGYVAQAGLKLMAVLLP
jgi:hypothetical protein